MLPNPSLFVKLILVYKSILSLIFIDMPLAGTGVDI